jgi:hypothetical protein
MKTNWTFEMLQKEAFKYKTRTEFSNKSRNAYSTAQSRGILDLICSHMKYVYINWTYNSLKKEALKYKTRGEFYKNSPKAYDMAQHRKILNEICTHMKSIFTNWTFKMLHEEALKYKSRIDFQIYSPNAYFASRRRNILDKICSHMKPSIGSSRYEKELLKKIKIFYPNSKWIRDRKVKIINKPHIKGFDLDIYIPELNKAIEFDGKYWHSFEGLSRGRSHWPQKDIKNYHEIKDNYFLTKNIKILHIKEENWLKNKEKCIKQCLKFLRN